MTLRRTKCAHCKKRLEPERPGQVLHAECAIPWAEAQYAKKERIEAKRQRAIQKVDRQLIRERKQALKTIPQLIKEAQREFNAYIRWRDKEKHCICCGAALSRGGESTGGEFDCGHFRSVGSAPHLRFDERNAHGQRKVCNRYGAGRSVDYRIGLIDRIGASEVEALEADNRVHHWTRDELISIRDKYRQKLKELKNAERA